MPAVDYTGRTFYVGDSVARAVVGRYTEPHLITETVTCVGDDHIKRNGRVQKLYRTDRLVIIPKMWMTPEPDF